MLDFEAVLELMRKYGYSSTSIHPYIYQNGDTLGICYTYIDEEYGLLERIKTFDNLESFELFLQEQTWLKSNSKNYNVRMILDNYESAMPKVLYLRNEKIMVEGEMFDIDTFDFRDSQRKQMDDVSKILYEAGDLLLVYDEIKSRQLQYLKKIIALKNELRSKYFDLQKEIDIYNKYKVERSLTLLPDVLDKGNINEALEVTIKDQYNAYIANRPSLEEMKDFIKQVWELNLNLELNTKYYEAQKEENDVRNEIKVVDKKIELMRSLNENLKPLFGVDLVGKFKKINEKCRKESKYMSKNYVSERLSLINKKYDVYDKLNLFYVSDYLREAIQNTNYDDLAIKYSIDAKEEDIKKVKLPLNDVVADLVTQYRNKLSTEEQSLLVLYNNEKYAKIFNTLLEIDNYETLPVKNIIKKLNTIKGFSKIKTECYDSVKKRIDDPVNSNIKQTLFANVDFTTFETFIMSMIKRLGVLKTINNKMMINSDINMYTLVNKVEDVLNRKYISMTNDLNAMLSDAKENKCMIGICLLKENLPVLYSPYYFDLGDIYSKDASPLMEIKEKIGFELLIDRADVSVFVDDIKVDVSRYYTVPKVNENISYVDDIMLNYSTTFCKYSLASNIVGEPVVVSNNVPANNGVSQSIEPAPVVTVPPVVEQNNVVMTSNVKEVATNVNNEKKDEVVTKEPTINSVDTVNGVSPVNVVNTEVKADNKTENKVENNFVSFNNADNTSVNKDLNDVKKDTLKKDEQSTKDKVLNSAIPTIDNVDSQDKDKVNAKAEETIKESSKPMVKPEDLSKPVATTEVKNTSPVNKVENKVVPPISNQKKDNTPKIEETSKGPAKAMVKPEDLNKPATTTEVKNSPVINKVENKVVTPVSNQKDATPKVGEAPKEPAKTMVKPEDLSKPVATTEVKNQPVINKIENKVVSPVSNQKATMPKVGETSKEPAKAMEKPEDLNKTTGTTEVKNFPTINKIENKDTNVIKANDKPEETIKHSSLVGTETESKKAVIKTVASIGKPVVKTVASIGKPMNKKDNDRKV